MATLHPSDAHAEWRVPDDLRLRLLALLSTQPDCAPTMTYEEFLDWSDEDTLAEWVDGTVVMTSPASLRHQLIAQFLFKMLSSFSEMRQLGLTLTPPFQMKLAGSGREPDVLYVANAHLDRLKPTFLDGAADLVVEIISPESAGRDRGDKYFEYEQANIPEYWLIDPDRTRAEFYRLGDDGRYQLARVGEDNVYHSAVVPGFWLHVGWLWQEPLPQVARTLLQVAGEEYARWMIEQLREGGYLRDE